MTPPAAAAAAAASSLPPTSNRYSHQQHPSLHNDNDLPPSVVPRHSPTKGPAPPIPTQHSFPPADSLGAPVTPPRPAPRSATAAAAALLLNERVSAPQPNLSRVSGAVGGGGGDGANNNLGRLDNESMHQHYHASVDNNTSRVIISSPSHHLHQQQQQQQQVLPPSSGEPVYELEKKGHTSVIRVSYPAPEPTVTFPPSEPSTPSSAPVQPPIPPARRAAPTVPEAPLERTAVKQHEFLPALSVASTMGLENFKFCTVLGRGHFGKVITKY